MNDLQKPVGEVLLILPTHEIVAKFTRELATLPTSLYNYNLEELISEAISSVEYFNSNNTVESAEQLFDKIARVSTADVASTVSMAFFTFACEIKQIYLAYNLYELGNYAPYYFRGFLPPTNNIVVARYTDTQYLT